MNHLEKIERDLQEIEELQNRLQADRGYTAAVRDSLENETVRLTDLRARIANLIIKDPPERLSSTLEKDAVFITASMPISQKSKSIKSGLTSSKTAEIILPNRKKQASKSGSRKPIPTRKINSGSSQKSTESSSTKPEFQWKFVQK